MPEYLYQNPKTGEVRSVIQRINEEHAYTDKDGLKWTRIFTVPQMSIDTKMDASTDPKTFSRITGNKRGTYGDLFDQSKELSEARKKMYGKDPVKKKYWDDWSKRRKGKKHPKMFED